MKKDKIICVSVCDFCAQEDRAVWKCVHCDKEACSACGANWAMYSEAARSWADTSASSVTISSGYRVPEFSAFICNDCSKNEMAGPLLRFGFKNGETRTVGSATRKEATSN